MIFIDLEKVYNRIPRYMLWWTLSKKTLPIKYVSSIKDKYVGVVTNVSTGGRLTDGFPVTIRADQGSTLS